MTKNDENLQFGSIAIKLGFTSLERIDECLKLQAKMRELGVAPKKLGEIMHAKGYVTDPQVKEIFHYQGMRGAHTQIAGYKIITKIGAGAMGSIYKALQISMDPNCRFSMFLSVQSRGCVPCLMAAFSAGRPNASHPNG